MEGGLLSLKWNNHRSSFIHVLSSLRKKDSFCDVTLACDGKFYPSHKLVLSTCSDYFQEMFQQTQCKHPVIVLKDIRCEDLEALLNYMYVGEVNVIQEKLSTLIKAAECLRIKGLAVPDDPPKDTNSERRSSALQDFAPESKRRKLDSEHHRSKDLYRSHKQSKSTDTQFSPGAAPEASFQSPVQQPDNSSLDSRNFNFENEVDSSNLPKSKERDGEFIKQEPPDTYIDIDLVDTKEGILQRSQPQFLSPAHRQDESSNIETMGTSDSQDIWGSESKSGDDYPTLEGGENSGPGNDDPSQSEPVCVESGVWYSNDSSSLVNEDFSLEVYPYMPNSFSLQSIDIENHSQQSANPVVVRKPAYRCTLCSYVASQKSNLMKHRVVHSGEKPFACHLCPVRSTQKGNLKRHYRRVHPHLSIPKL